LSCPRGLPSPSDSPLRHSRDRGRGGLRPSAASGGSTLRRADLGAGGAGLSAGASDTPSRFTPINSPTSASPANAGRVRRLQPRSASRSTCCRSTRATSATLMLSFSSASAARPQSRVTVVRQNGCPAGSKRTRKTSGFGVDAVARPLALIAGAEPGLPTGPGGKESNFDFRWQVRMSGSGWSVARPPRCGVSGRRPHGPRHRCPFPRHPDPRLAMRTRRPVHRLPLLLRYGKGAGCPRRPRDSAPREAVNASTQLINWREVKTDPLRSYRSSVRDEPRPRTDAPAAESVRTARRPTGPR
jgi:hypothetical protein